MHSSSIVFSVGVIAWDYTRAGTWPNVVVNDILIAWSVTGFVRGRWAVGGMRLVWGSVTCFVHRRWVVWHPKNNILGSPYLFKYIPSIDILRQSREILRCHPSLLATLPCPLRAHLPAHLARSHRDASGAVRLPAGWVIFRCCRCCWFFFLFKYWRWRNNKTSLHCGFAVVSTVI